MADDENSNFQIKQDETGHPLDCKNTFAQFCVFEKLVSTLAYAFFRRMAYESEESPLCRIFPALQRIQKALRNIVLFPRAFLQLFSCWRIDERDAVLRADFLNDIPNTLNVHRILVHVHLQSGGPMVHIGQLQLVLVRSHPFQRVFRIQQVSSFREQIKREVTRCTHWRCIVCGEDFLIVTCGQIRQF